MSEATSERHQRQHLHFDALAQLARQSEVVIVIGGAHSNNTRELVNTCRHYCCRVHHVQTAADLHHEWFCDAGTVGITAGTSLSYDSHRRTSALRVLRIGL